MKKSLLILAALFTLFACGGNETPGPDPVPETPVVGPEDALDFARGADISWASEMVAGGVKFRKKDGTVADLFTVLADCGFNAVRLRVWVDAYKGWSGQADVVDMARKAQAAGLYPMIDFHYSDFFADPSRQRIPAAWEADQADLAKMCKHVADHTTAVLQALKAAGVNVLFIQIGNETRNGMLWPAGQLWTQDGDIPEGRQHFAQLYNAGYDAAKAVFSSAVVMPHLNHAYEDNSWWFQQIKAAGGKFDAIALSHYPQADNLDGKGKETMTSAQCNQKAIENIKKLYSTFQVPIYITEVGVKPAKSDAASVMAAFYQSAKSLKGKGCAGVFYWEPEVYGGWVPAVYKDAEAIGKYTGKKETWGSYDQGAFTASGSPSSILDCFGQ